jgi:heteromeric Ino2p/Ino4p transcription factor
MITPDSSMSEGKGSRKKKACLSEEEKKKHHIESEHRRRLAIRDAFSRLAELVPELDPVDARSEILVMSKSADYLKQLYLEHRSLLMKLEQKGTPVDQALKLRLPDVDLDTL